MFNFYYHFCSDLDPLAQIIINIQKGGNSKVKIKELNKLFLQFFQGFLEINTHLQLLFNLYFRQILLILFSE